ncbi:CaiB/BaiF CoA transferase family protein [Sphingomonas colocasiae]|uniref:CoA transferase n=1 Tax=Sphingomonas colocasiae TaxID=1848973 RepID=A0ABS7PTD4_9SPHN|nr:CoA transferase [Sphingomonas colocasiae]MBY8824478.1 CoA transferase [Sphingomonas colocasiae]
MQTLPLSGIRILSFEQFGAAPYATMFFADMGAEVIKIECGDGDFARRTGPRTLGDGDSLYFQCFNMNKNSVALDIRLPDDYQRFLGLVGGAHAVVNNMRGHLVTKRRIDYASLMTVNPAIVCGHISAYGRDNSRAALPGYDFLMQAEAGLMALTGEPGSPPTRMGASMIDYMTGMTFAFAVMSAIHAAARDGIGRDVDVSLYDVAIHQLAYQGAWYLNEGIVTERAPRSAHPSTTPVQLFRTRDGWIYVACMNDRFWDLLCKTLGRDDLVGAPAFADMAGRLRAREELTEILDRIFEGQPNAHWLALLRGIVPVAAVHSLEEALESPFLIEESGMIREIAHPHGPLRMFANPIKLDGARVPQSAGPALGAGNDGLLG